MPLQLSAYFASIANTAADQQIAAVADGLIPTRDNALVVPKESPKVLLAHFFGTNLTVAKLKPASLRRFGDYWVEPFANAIGGAGAITPYLDLTDGPGGSPPLVLDPQEELPAYGQQSSAGAQNAYAFVLFNDQKAIKREGTFFTVRATGTTTVTANAWSACTLTMDTGLPAGTYNLVGARFKGVSPLAFRFIIARQNNRPGGLAFQGDQSFEPTGQRNGGWGIWGTFDHLSIPTLEAFCTAADTAQTVWFDLEKIA